MLENREDEKESVASLGERERERKRASGEKEIFDLFFGSGSPVSTLTLAR